MIKKVSYRITILLIIGVFILQPVVFGAVRTSIGIIGGVGIPIGWWSERWDAFPMSELNLRYEFTPGTGIIIITALGKSYYGSMSPDEITAESKVRIQPEFQPYTTITNSDQSGSFKQLPVGFGFYTERLIGGLRGYASIAMLVNIWKFERSQELLVEVAVPERDVAEHTDDWWDEQDGTNIGGQIAFGLVYPLKNLFLIDISAAYNYVSISKKHAALSYWGKPVRNWDSQRIDEATGRADYIQLRIGIRYGR